MKKLFVITMMVLIISSLTFAESTIGNESSTLSLSLDGDEYRFGFSLSPDFTSADNIPLDEVIDIEAGTVRLGVKTFYFFYKAVTDDSTVNFTIKVTPMYPNGIEPTTESDDEKANQTIHYTANINQTSVWNGALLSQTLDTKTSTDSTACLIKDDSFKNYLTNGIAGIVISSSEALEGKIPGNYKGTITVTMKSGL